MAFENLHLFLTELEAWFQTLSDCTQTKPKARPEWIFPRQGHASTLAIKAQSESPELTDELTRVVTHLNYLAESLRQYDSKQLDKLSPIRKALKQGVLFTRIVRLGLSDGPRKAGVRLGRRLDRVLDQWKDADYSNDEPQNAARRARVYSDCRRTLGCFAAISDRLIQLELGQAARFANYETLRLSGSQLGSSHSDIQLHPLALTRSGSTIAAVHDQGEAVAVYKEGTPDKLRAEIEGVRRWRKQVPNLVPRLLHIADQRDSLLIEHVAGETLEALIMQQSNLTAQGFTRTFKRLRKIWRESRIEVACQPKFMEQVETRLDECTRLHPELFDSTHQLNGWQRPAFRKLVETVKDKEHRWQAPFSVLIHGDFNVDNVIYDARRNEVMFIDLHRSAYFDYVQDVSVIMASIYRLPALSNVPIPHMLAFRRRIAEYVYSQSRAFARKNADTAFDARLACGLARSFATSTRFVADTSQAKRFALRSRFLLDSLAHLSPQAIHRYKLPLKALYAS